LKLSQVAGAAAGPGFVGRRRETAAVGRVIQDRKVPVDLLAHLRRARDHIDRHYRSALDLAQIAQVAGVSKYHFVRRFEETYGETPIRYLTRRRIERAQDLLRAANLTVTEVCMLVGFTSLGSFSSRFTQLVGESPTAYRNRWAVRGTPRIPGCYLFMRGVMDHQGTSAISEKPDPSPLT
jgi:AraC-like DNA-binding protein